MEISRDPPNTTENQLIQLWYNTIKEEKQRYKLEETPQIMKLKTYHHYLDESTDDFNAEDRYQRHVWKIKRIIKHKIQDGVTFLFVQWMNDSECWVPLEEIRHQHPHSCSIYALKNKLTKQEQW